MGSTTKGGAGSVSDVEMSGDLGDKSFYRGTSEVRGNASDVGGDDGSEKAIWQTRSVTVEVQR
jgi:hypothetical protein